MFAKLRVSHKKTVRFHKNHGGRLAVKVSCKHTEFPPCALFRSDESCPGSRRTSANKPADPNPRKTKKKTILFPSRSYRSVFYGLHCSRQHPQPTALNLDDTHQAQAKPHDVLLHNSGNARCVPGYSTTGDGAGYRLEEQHLSNS